MLQKTHPFILVSTEFIITLFYLLVGSLCINVDTYIPGYAVDINGLSQQVNNLYFDSTTNSMQQCPSNCGTCINSSTCTSCNYGFFLWTPPYNNDQYCVACPLYDIMLATQVIACADCINNPLTWSQTKRCTFSYSRISEIQNSNIIRYRTINDYTTQHLFEVYALDTAGQQIQVKEFTGGDAWCGNNSITKLSNCSQRSTSNPVDQSQTAVVCRQGYVFSTQMNQCVNCPPNCDFCSSPSQCVNCSQGYALGAKYGCIQCSNIPQCQSCYYGDSKTSLQDSQYLLANYASEGDLNTAGYFLRCTSCSSTPSTFYVPSLDLQTCKDCSSLGSNCLACRYAKVTTGGVVIDHTQNPFVVLTADIINFNQYCLSCVDPYFINYNGQCEQCTDTNCELCYYGTLSGTNAQLTLSQNFPYTSSQGSLIKKCIMCVYDSNSSALGMDGTCMPGLSFLNLKSSNCAKWRQIVVATPLDATQFECTECKNGYGFDVTKPPNQRVCDQSGMISGISNCNSFYYTTASGSVSPVTCTRCNTGYVALPSLGCISCSTGLPAGNDMMSMTNPNCQSCNLQTANGLNFTQIMITTQIATSKQTAIDVEKQYQLLPMPFCNQCQNTRVYNQCTQQCFSSCYKDMGMGNVYNGCKFSSLTQNMQCESCGSEQGIMWSTNDAVSNDNSSCIQCPRYCLQCKERTQAEMNLINPYFKPVFFEQRKYANKCITCRNLGEICSDYQNQIDTYRGYHLNCVDQTSSTIYYDPKIKQCTPCPNNICNRTLKIQQIVECRPNISPADIQIGSNQNSYYTSKAGGMNPLNHLYSTVNVIFLDQWNTNQSLSISFKELDEINSDNLYMFLGLNEENVSNIEFEVLFIPQVTSYTTNDGVTKSNANVCQFPNDVNFSAKLAKHIANINTMKLSFKMVNSQSGTISDGPLDLFITSMSFQGWNYYSFVNINFLPMYSIMPTAQVKSMMLNFSQNQFQSRIDLKGVTFNSGFTVDAQQQLLQNIKQTFAPVIDLTNVYYLYINNVVINTFVYQKGISLFQFNPSAASQLQSFTLNSINMSMNNCYFDTIDLISLYNNSVSISFNTLTINGGQFSSVNFINQLSGYNQMQSSHTINMVSTQFVGTTLIQSTIINAYNLLSLNIDTFTLSLKQKMESSVPIYLFTSNTFTLNKITITSSSASLILFDKVGIFQFPPSSASMNDPILKITTLTLQNIQFNINGGFINLSAYPNKYSNRGSLNIQSITITGCQGSNMGYYLISLYKIKTVNMQQITVQDFYGGCFFASDTVDQITVSQGSLSQASVPSWFPDDSYVTSNAENNNQHGTAFYVKNLRTFFQLISFNFQYQYIIDRALIKFEHEQLDSSSPVEQLNNNFVNTFISQATAYDKLAQTVPTVLINNCNFDQMNVYVYNSDMSATLLYFKTTIKYRYMLVSVKGTNLKSYTLNDELFKDSSTFLVQDSQDSSLYMYDLTIQQSTSSLLIQNGLLVKCTYFTLLNSNFDTANYNQPNKIYSYKGGFINLLGQIVIIDTTNFSKSVSDQGGALFIKGFSKAANFKIKNSHFTDVRTSFNSQSTGVGGAISIDGTSSIDLTIDTCVFTSSFAYLKGGVLDLTCGQQICTVMLTGNTINNVFATTGSIFNVKLNKSTQQISFISNTYSSNLGLNDMLGPYSNYQQTDSGMDQSLTQFYAIVQEGGTLVFKSNTFTNLSLLQGIISLYGVILTDESTTFTNSNFRSTPIFLYNQVTFQSLKKLTVGDIQECSDCQNNNNLLFLSKHSITTFNNFYLIENPVNLITLDSFDVELVTCTQCSQGIIGITNPKLGGSVTNGIFKTNVSNKGVLYFSGLSSTLRNRILQSTGSTFSINQTKFSGNTANQGGAIYSQYQNIQLNSAFILSNNAQYGGGVYFLTSESNPNTFIAASSFIQQNTANVGGGAKIIGTFIQNNNSQVNQNTALKSGADLTTYPVGLKVFLNGREIQLNSNSGQVEFMQWISGVSTNQNLIFYLVGTDNTIQALDDGMSASLTINLNYPAEVPTYAKVSGVSTVNYDSTIGGFSLDKLVLQQMPLDKLQIKATSTAIKKPIYDSQGNLLNIDTSYQLPLLFGMRLCTVGQAYISSTGTCFECTKDTFSLLENSLSCQECPKNGVQQCPGRNQLQLEAGYWRPDPSSDLIEECFNSLSNCNGGLNTGDSSCSEGHIGALCEVCDISGRYWPENYSNSGEFSCGKCKEITGNTLKMVGLTIYTLIAILLSVKSTKALLDSYIIAFYFQQAGFLPKSAVQSAESVGIIIKLFTTYIQLILVITTFKLELPPGLNELTVSVGDPAKQMSFSMDCALFSISGNVPMTYFRLMWSQLMPILYVVSYLIGHYFYEKIRRIRSRAVIAWISFIYIYISMQPSIVKSNIQTVSCRYISGDLYIKSNVSEKCYTPEHIKYTLILILPTLIVWVLVIPLLFLKKMYDGRDRLHKIEMQHKYGFLYTEYKRNSYFWEIVKIFQKTFVTIFINIYDGYNDIKGIFVIFILIIYLKLQITQQPYSEKRFNNLDTTSNLVVIISIILAMFIYNNPYSYLIWLSYIVLVTINAIFIAKLIIILISGYTSKFEAKIGDYLIKFSSKFPKIAKVLRIPTVRRERLNQLWKSLRLYVQKQYPKKIESLEEKKDAINVLVKQASVKYSKSIDQPLNFQDNISMPFEQVAIKSKKGLDYSSETKKSLNQFSSKGENKSDENKSDENNEDNLLNNIKQQNFIQQDDFNIARGLKTPSPLSTDKKYEQASPYIHQNMKEEQDVQFINIS